MMETGLAQNDTKRNRFRVQNQAFASFFPDFLYIIWR